MIRDVDSFVAYFDRVYERTLEVARAIPTEYYAWAPRPSDLTAAEVIHHIASTEVMNVQRVAAGIFHYPGHADQLGAPVAYLMQCHDHARQLLIGIPVAQLDAQVEAFGGRIAGWRLLLGMIEHEVHHRSQLCSYLTALGLGPPPLFGIALEELPAIRQGGVSPGEVPPLVDAWSDDHGKPEGPI